MTLDRFKWEVLDYTGYVFCEFAFRWFDVFDGPIPGDEDYRWYHCVPNFIGRTSYRIGCFFYGLQDDKLKLD